MDIAFEEAEEALKESEVPVGCAVFYEGECVARAHNLTNALKNPLAHAEMLCLKQIPKEIFPDLEIFVTCEPCIMCMSVLLKIKVKSITFGCINPRFGGVFLHNTQKILNLTTKIRQEQADRSVSLLKSFYTLENPQAPPEKRKNKSNRTRKIFNGPRAT